MPSQRLHSLSTLIIRATIVATGCLLILLSSSSVETSTLPESDCDVLRLLYDETDGQRWKRQLGWNSSSIADCCNWHGVECAEVGGVDRVTSLQLTNNGLNGTISSQVGLLSELLVLNITGNRELKGSLPPELSELSSILLLNLSTNALDGVLPTQWSSWESIMSVSLSDNNLAGELPYEWGQWTYLHEIALDQNMLNGSLPPEWASWKNVSAVNLSRNNLVGELPRQWCAWLSITQLGIHQNNLHGPLPTEWSTLSSLSQIGLSLNAFSGSLPSEWRSWESIAELNLYGNVLTGSLPTQWSEWTSVSVIVLSNNSLHGTLPSQWSAWHTISELDISQNELTGTLPSEWGVWPSITALILSQNAISGSLPEAWSAWTSISYLILRSNKLSGSLPPAWGAWTSIYDIELSINRLEGGLPTAWGAWATVAFVGLADNLLTGSLPTDWSSWTLLNQLSLYENELSGVLPSQWSAWSSISGVGLSDNSLNGTLPTQWGQWTSIGEFLISNNRLSGQIPTEFNAWTHLDRLDVGANDLEGSICICVQGLSILSVYDNHFTHIDPCLAETSVVRLNLQGNTFVQYPAALVTSHFLTILDLCSSDLELHLGNLPHREGGISVVRICNNPDVSGSLDDFLGSPSGAAASGYVELDVSNTSISGTLEHIDPHEWEHQGSPFPLRNLEVLTISDNAGMTGGLPLKWFDWVSGHQGRLVVNAENVTGLRAPSPADVSFDTDRPRQVYNNELSYRCLLLKWPMGITVLGIDPSYFNYSQCECAAGFSGSPPHCTRAADTTTIVLAALFSIALAASLLFGGHRLRRWRAMARDFRRAEALLAGYAKHSAKWTGAQESASSPFDVLQRQDIHAQLLSPSLSEDWMVPYDDIQIVKTVASGAQGRVSMALWNRTVVALKQFFALTEDDQCELMGEASIHVQLRHPNLVQLLGVCIDPLCTVTEWMDRGSLFDVIHDRPETLPNIHSVALDIARGMLYLHSKGIIHRDLKSLNVMLDGHGTAKVGDFGTARYVVSDATMTIGQGTSHWMAPEVFQGGRYTESCDVYSYGIILWELCTLARPFSDLHFAHQVQGYVCRGGRPVIPSGSGVPDLLVSLMQRCWDAEPSQRPSFESIVDELECSQ